MKSIKQLVDIVNQDKELGHKINSETVRQSVYALSEILTLKEQQLVIKKMRESRFGTTNTLSS
jgi:hypothetical protein